MQNSKWEAGTFQKNSAGRLVFKTGGNEIELVSGLEIETTLSGGHRMIGRVGKRDDGFYFLGRMPMFAIPLVYLIGAEGRLLTTPDAVNRHARSA